MDPMPEPLTVLGRALVRRGIVLDDLRRGAQAIALFGSRAAGCATASSDWDLLCVGTGDSSKLRGIDLVWVEPRAIETSAWLSGDLAGHVAEHGVWIEGEASWGLGAVDFAAAALRKEARLARYLHALTETWALLGPAYRAKHATLLRRDVQRWGLLQRGRPIPPTAALDELWSGDTARSWLAECFLGLCARPELARALIVNTEADADVW